MKYSKLLFILFLFICLPGFAENKPQGFRVEPYLLDVTTNSATIAFHLDTPLPAHVNVHNGPEIKKFSSNTKSKSHFIKITGLQPGLSYPYQVICGNNQIHTPPNDTSYRVRTASRPGEYFTFTVFGDPRPGDNLTNMHHHEVIQQAMLQEPMFNLVLGDMVDDGQNHKLWEDFFSIEAPLLRRSAIYPVFGDNDYSDRKGKYPDYFPNQQNGYYRFTWGGVQFIGLHAWDTNGSQPPEEFNINSPQYKWFQTQMSRPEVRRAPFRVVFLHDPVYICRGRASDTFRRTAEYLSQKDHRVYGTSRRTDSTLSTNLFQMIQMDVTDDSSVKQAIDRILDRESGIDVIVNNASMTNRYGETQII